MQPTLNTANPEYITYAYEQVQITLLGGFRIEGMDRMRVTIRLIYKQQTIRQNLDLYHDQALDKLIKKCVERFGLATVYMTTLMESLISTLESYRLEQLQRMTVKKEPAKPLSATEKQAAVDFLSQPGLLGRTNALIGESGVVGEEDHRLLMYLVFTSRKREHPLHIISLGSSGTGKTYLQERVAELIPPEDRIEMTALSENAFYYFGQQELSHKLLLIEDLDGAESSLYPLRELQTKRRIRKTVVLKDSHGHTQTTHLVVDGPVCVAGCTTKESIYEDNSNRSLLIYLDERHEQDERIMERQRLVSSGKIDTAKEKQVQEFLQNCQRVLEPVTIINPFAPFLKIPAITAKPRRTNTHYLQFIEAITFYKQYQRERKTSKAGQVYIETTLEDVAEANELMKLILLRKSDELTGAVRNYLERLKEYIPLHHKEQFTAREMSKGLRISISTVKRHHVALLQSGHLQLVSKENKSFTYTLTGDDYPQLQQDVHQVLDDILQQLIEQQKSTGSPSAQSVVEPVKPAVGKRKKSSAQ